MSLRFMRLMVIPAAAVLLTSCASQATPLPADVMATAVAQAAYDLMTQTAAAASPTPPPTATFTPVPTDTPTLTPTIGPVRRPQIIRFTGCWFGPGPTYVLESNISANKRVDLLGVGSEPGWYIIRNPYFHKPCWVKAEDLQIDPGTDLSQYPVMTPGPP
jgi:hypothetical protein